MSPRGRPTTGCSAQRRRSRPRRPAHRDRGACTGNGGDDVSAGTRSRVVACDIRAYPAITDCPPHGTRARMPRAFASELFTRDYRTDRAQLIAWAQFEDAPLRSANYPAGLVKGAGRFAHRPHLGQRHRHRRYPPPGPGSRCEAEHATDAVSNVRVSLDQQWEQQIVSGYKPPDPLATVRDVSLTWFGTLGLARRATTAILSQHRSAARAARRTAATAPRLRTTISARMLECPGAQAGSRSTRCAGPGRYWGMPARPSVRTCSARSPTTSRGVANSAVSWLWQQLNIATSIDLTSPNIKSDLIATGAIAALVTFTLFLIQVIADVCDRTPAASARQSVGSASRSSVRRLRSRHPDPARCCRRVVQRRRPVRPRHGRRGMGSKLIVRRHLVDQQPCRLLLISLVLIAAVVIVWVALMIRKMLIIISAVFAPMAFSGASSDISRRGCDAGSSSRGAGIQQADPRDHLHDRTLGAPRRRAAHRRTAAAPPETAA